MASSQRPSMYSGYVDSLSANHSCGRLPTAFASTAA